MLYNFDRLIDKYSVDFTLVSISEGNYIGGKYVAGNRTETPCRGAIVPLPDKKIYQSGGTLTTKDRQLYMKTPISDPLKTTKVNYKSNEYSIEQDTNWGDYANAFVYVLKWVSSLSD